MKKPFFKSLSRKNDIRPFDAVDSLEFLSKKNDCSLFMVASHSKKRPNNVVMGRFFNYQILDMIELGVLDYKSIDSFKSMKVLSFFSAFHVESGRSEAHVPVPERFVAIFGATYVAEESDS